MNISSKIIIAVALLVSGAAAITSCNKPDVITYSQEGKIYMPQAAGDISNMDMILADTPQVFVFGAAYGGLNYPSQDIAVKFDINSAAVSAYNAAHGTSYVLLPQGSYTIPKLDATIKSGATSSDAIPVSIITKNLDRSQKYILPVQISTVSSGFIDSALKTTYFTIDTIQRLEKDITAKATLTVSQDNPSGPDAGEGSKKLVDNNNNSKFLMAGFYSGFWMQLEFPTPEKIGAYTITSGNDAPDRDAVDWQLVGSNDGTTWTVLDERTGQVFPNRNQVIRFEFDNNTAYKYYRWIINANGGSNLLQISEWRLITYP
jgi:hypothetical protein